jgi:hypothetical protein
MGERGMEAREGREGREGRWVKRTGIFDFRFAICD